jgi:hypothetical protein
MARAGLKKVIKTVKGKRGSARRAYWVKSDPNAGKKKPGFLRRHAGKILGAAALVGGAYLAHRAGATAAAKGAVRGTLSAYRDAKAMRSASGPKIGVGEKISGAMAAVRHGGAAGAREATRSHYEGIASRHTEGKGSRIDALLHGAASGDGVRGRVREARNAVRQAGDHRDANKSFDRAARHLEKQQGASGVFGGIRAAYHGLQARRYANAGSKRRAAARS